MAKKTKSFRPKARVPRGLTDGRGASLTDRARMLAQIEAVFSLYGFEALETSALEYSDCLGKFLPDQDRPNEGVFSFEDDDGQWLSLRYDLTAPLARYVAEHYDGLPKPFRRYQTGPVWRNEKPGPGRFRQFTQFDADTVGSPLMAADAEICMLLAQTLETLGIRRDDFVIKVNNRKILDGVLSRIGLDTEEDDFSRVRLTVLRAIDKLDRLGLEGVESLLGEGRKDESGDFTAGAGLQASERAAVLDFLQVAGGNRASLLKDLTAVVAGTQAGEAGLEELTEIDALLTAAGFAD
ncbi:MAG: HisS family protein, partial [Pseudomonadota bacterium]